MEFPHLGKQCSEATCNKLDFLPVKCDACKNIFCQEHMKYASHSCASAYKKDVQVPVCPLCNVPIPIRRGEPPDIAVGAHIDRDCQSDPAKDRRKVFSNKCSMKGCKGKEVVPVLCSECQLNFCLKHRHTADHNCQGKSAASRNRAAVAALSRQKFVNANRNHITAPATTSIQGSLSEDEALAQALHLSMQENSTASAVQTSTSEEQLLADAELARALAESERDTRRAVTSASPNNQRCLVS